MRRVSANYIFTNTGNPIRNGVVGVDDHGEIVEIIDHKGKEKEYAHTEFRNGIIVPGFVNTHCHVELSHLKKRVKPNTGLAGFVDQIRNYRLSSEEPCDSSIEDALAEMHRTGTVAVVDICNTTDSFVAKQNSKIQIVNLVEVLGLEKDKAQWILEKAQTIKQIAEDTLGGKNCLTPHSVYSLSSTLMESLRNEIYTNSIVSIHFAESPDEGNFTTKRAGGIAKNYENWGLAINDAPTESPVNIVKKHLPPNANILFVHNTYLQKNQAKELAKHFPNAYLALCPASNIYIENRLPDVPMLMSIGCPITLGTDSLASSPTLSVFDQMQIISHHFPSIPFTEILKWATINGANAIASSNRLGTIELGKSPGLNLITPFDFANNKTLPNSRVVKLI